MSPWGTSALSRGLRLFFAGRPSLSITPWVGGGVKVCNPWPSAACAELSQTPQAACLSVRKACWLFQSLVQVRNLTLVSHSELGRNMTGVHGNNTCADVSSSLKISENVFNKEGQFSIYCQPLWAEKGGQYPDLTEQRRRMMNIAKTIFICFSDLTLNICHKEEWLISGDWVNVEPHKTDV